MKNTYKLIQFESKLLDKYNLLDIKIDKLIKERFSYLELESLITKLLNYKDKLINIDKNYSLLFNNVLESKKYN